MTLDSLRDWAVDKPRFTSVDTFIDFAIAFAEFREAGNFQAELVSRNTHQYRFFQFTDDANFQISRPVNSELFYSADLLDDGARHFRSALEKITNGEQVDAEERDSLNRLIYTCQQSIGITLDALPATKSNQARKVNGDLFERFITLVIEDCGISCRSGVLRVPVADDAGTELFSMNYQHDLMIEDEGELKAIGSVKTSSKDRLAKVFIDKFLYRRLTSTDIPHFAVFLHDVQRAGREPNFGTSNTFLTGSFKGFTMKLNALYGVYYCDLLPNMRTDPLLREHIQSIDVFLADDLSNFIDRTDGPPAALITPDE